MNTEKEQLIIKGDLRSGALFSKCMSYRYSLTRVWNPDNPKAGMVAFIGLNPSTADEHENDPTVTRCINYAKGWGMDGMYMLNIFAYRATDPKVMKAHPDPIGISNDNILELITGDLDVCKIAVAAWGVNGTHLGRDAQVIKLLSNVKLKCLGVTKDGHPKHPLYLRNGITPILFKAP